MRVCTLTSPESVRKRPLNQCAIFEEAHMHLRFGSKALGCFQKVTWLSI